MRKFTVRSMVEIPGSSLDLSEKCPRIFLRFPSCLIDYFHPVAFTVCWRNKVRLLAFCAMSSPGRLDVIHKPVGSRAGSSGHGGEARTARSAAAWDATCGNSQAQVKLQLACTVTDACTVLHIFDHIYCNQSFIYAWLASRCM